MTDQWVPGPPPPPPAPPNGLPPSNSWIAAVPCATSGDNPSIVDGVVITGVPAQVLAPGAWGITLNDGGAPPNFSIDHYDASGALIESPIEISGASGDVTLNHDPTQELGAATKHYVDNTGLREAPIDNTTYGRDNGAWVPLPGSYMPEAPNTTQLYGRFNSTWSLVPIQTDAPVDGQAYVRQSGAWALGVTGGPYLPLNGGTMTGALIMQGSNMIALNAPLTGGGQAAILGQKATANRWQMLLGDQTAEGVGNAGSNFTLNAFSTTGVMLGTWLTIARADGATTFNGSGVTIQGGLSVNGTFAVAGPGNLAIYGGNPGDALTTNGAGILAWGARVAEAPTDGQFYSRRSGAWAVSPGGMTDAPNDGTAYARKSQAWAHLTHADITDWAANVPPASTTPPLMDGAAAPGSAGAFARGDHVHPTDTSRYAASNPSGFQTAAQVTASLASYLPLAGGSMTGTITNNPGAGNFGLIINGASGSARAILGQTAGVSRWALQLGNGAIESGSSVGSDFNLVAYNDTAATQIGSFQIQRASMATSINASGATGWAGVGAVGDASLMLNKATAAGNSARVFGVRNGVFRWALALGLGVTESGSNTGSDFVIQAYTDAGAGAPITPLTITRSNQVCTFGAAIVNGPSDRTLKENIAPLEGALDKVLALQGVSFNLIATPDKREIGLIAQDVEPVVPEIIQEYATSEVGEDGELKAAEPKLALDYPKLTALLIEAVKTLTARVSELEAARG